MPAVYRVNVHSLKILRHAVGRNFRNKQKEYLKAKIDERETRCKTKNIRDLCRSISDFQNGSQPRTNTVKDEKGELVTDYVEETFL
jgi:hypothetical protein